MQSRQPRESREPGDSQTGSDDSTAEMAADGGRGGGGDQNGNFLPTMAAAINSN